MTVKECISFSACLRLPRSWSRSAIDGRVDEILRIFSLQECASNRIGESLNRNISGGQMKRTCIGIEMVTDPNLLLLDEPTTGLDAFNAQSLMEMVKEYAVERGKIVITTIHQPRTELLGVFDKLLIMTQGKCVFFGTVPEAFEHFSVLGYPCPMLCNPADFYVDLVAVDPRTEEKFKASTERIAYLVNAWEELNPIQVVDYDPFEIVQKYSIRQEPRALKSYQFHLLFWRYMKSSRQFSGSWAIVIQFMFLTLLVSFVFFQLDYMAPSGVQTFTSAVVIVPIVLMVVTIMPLSSVFPMKHGVIVRESYVETYSLPLAYLAMYLSCLPIRILGSIFLVFASYWIIGFKSGFQYALAYYCITLCFLLSCVAIGLTIGSLFHHIRTVQVFMPLILVVFFFFSGYVVNSDEVSPVISWIRYVSVVYWLFTASMQLLSQGEIYYLGETGAELVERAGIEGPGFWFDILMLIAITFVYILLGMIFIHVNYRAKTKII